MFNNDECLGTMKDGKDGKGPYIYTCIKCDYNGNHKGQWTRHLNSKKHKMLKMFNNDEEMFNNDEEIIIKGQRDNLDCMCGKKYKHFQSFYRHRKKCNIYLKSLKPKTSNIRDTQDISGISGETFTKEEVLKLLITMNKNQEESNKNQEESMKIMTDAIVKISEKPTTVNNNNSNNNNSNNTNFNIQMFLNEECKNAMNIQDFVQQLQITMTDLLSIKYNKESGFSNILENNLKDIPEHDRPVHHHKKDWYINDKTVGWKEDSEVNVLKKSQFAVGKKYKSVFEESNPDWDMYKSDQTNDDFMEITVSIMGDISVPKCKKQMKIVKDICTVGC